MTGAPPASSESEAAPAGRLRRPLATFDLVLAHVIVVVGLNWSGPAATAGAAGPALWVLGIVLFHLPLAVVVADLARRMPEEGGLARWATAAFGPRVGFLTGWSSWSFLLVYNSTLGILLATSAAYLSTGSAAVAESKGTLVVAAFLGVALLAGLALAGLDLARWLHAASAIALLFAIALCIAALASDGLPGVGAPRRPVAFDLATAVLFTRVTVYGLAGLECLAVLAGEVRRPERSLPRSIAFAAPLVAVAYLATTALIARVVPAGEIDLVQPFGQVATRLVAAGIWSRAIASAFLAALLLRELGLASQAFIASTRLPLVGGWSGLLPAALGRVDRRGVPVNAILLSSGVALAVGLGAATLYSRQAAFQWILSTAGVLFGSTYVALFLIPLAGRALPGGRASLTVRIAATSGLVMTVAFLALAAVPILDVERPALFAVASGAGALAVIAGGGLVLRGAHRREVGGARESSGS